MSFKVIKSGTNRKLVYDFLLVVYSTFSLLITIHQRYWQTDNLSWQYRAKLHRILHRFWDTAA